MKKFVSVLLVLCCLMASCVPALALTDDEAFVIRFLQMSPFGDHSDDGYYYSLSADTAEKCIEVKCYHPVFSTLKTCDVAEYASMVDSYTRIFETAAETVSHWASGYYLKLSFCTKSDFTGDVYCEFSNKSGETVHEDFDVPIDADSNVYVSWGADADFLAKVVEVYGKKDGYGGYYYSKKDKAYMVKMNGAYVADMFAGYKGKAAKVTLTQDYLDDFSQLADFDTLNYSLVFLDDDGNLFFYASCQPGQDMTCLYLSK